MNDQCQLEDLPLLRLLMVLVTVHFLTCLCVSPGHQVHVLLSGKPCSVATHTLLNRYHCQKLMNTFFLNPGTGLR